MIRWIATAAVTVVLAACGGAAEVPADAPVAVGSADVPAALDWSTDLVGGGQLSGGDLAGRDVVLWFWAPW